MITKKKERLIKIAIDTSKNSFHPITSSGTGAAVLTYKGNIYGGCNVQSVISGLGTCAERCAIDNAVSHGEYKFRAMAVYFPAEKITRPCGACLQYINEFSQVTKKDILMIMINKKKQTKQSSIKKLLPDAYGPETAGKDLTKYRK